MRLRLCGIHTSESGQALILAVLLLAGAALSLTLYVSAPALEEGRMAQELLQTKTSYFTAEAGLEDYIYRIKKNLPYPVDGGPVSIGGNTATVAISGSADAKTILSTAVVNGNTRKLGLSFAKGEGSDFHYGIQIGDGNVTLESNSSINGNVYTNGSISGNGTINGTAFAAGSIEAGIVNPPSGAHPGAEAILLPVIQLDYWEEQAGVGGSISGKTITGAESLGPKKINGNLKIETGAVLTVTGPLYITGSLTFSGAGDDGGTMKLSDSFQSAGTYVVVEGKIVVNNKSTVRPTNSTPPGYIVLVSNSNDADDAILIDHSSSASILVAPLGGITILNQSHVVSLMGKAARLKQADLTYDQGLIDARFTSGPSGGWNIADWVESQ